MVVGGWNPWRELRRRTHLILEFDTLGGPNARIDELPGGRRQITLDVDLDQSARNAALSHELVHDERGLLPRGTPRRWREREEAIVRDETARRLVPMDLLEDFIRARVADFGCCEAPDVADMFEVPHEVAERAMRLLARTRHPTSGAA